MWIWTTPEPQRLVDDASRRGVDVLFVHVTPTVATDGDLPRLRRLHDLAGPAGLTLWALGGDASWVRDHAAALRWQRAALGTGLFVGSHLDVEPHAPSRAVPPAPLVDGHVRMLEALRADSSHPLEADLPFWAGTVQHRRSTWADAVLARVDAVTAMSYRDTAAAILDVGDDLLSRGDRAGVPVRLAVETRALSDCRHCTFFEEGEPAMRQAVATVSSTAARHPSFAGVAVHDYDGWNHLAERPAPGLPRIGDAEPPTEP